MPALTLTGRAVHTGEQAANRHTLFLDDWTRFDSRTICRVVAAPADLRVSVDNVTNEAFGLAFDSFRPRLQLGAPRPQGSVPGV